MLFSFSSFLYRHRRRRHSNILKKEVNSKEKKVLFFAKQTPQTRESPTKSTFFLSFFSVHSTSSLLTQLLLSPSIIQIFLGGFDYSTNREL